ncbi:periplasmic heavy metal sensor [Polymorphum gilvum]|uniref:Periplasmic heavy metal sensor n=1 Tax=Polymorphum gilvum (strain LMG 25793 / CGMCC 1.9160 / SL003B-26A1) TaxID=991905 RepID=F2J617_POLGS|nr:periplasmic heavy metal sensor [Polymorphum gilvum]ADZ72381.1 hypothetical protein SL003B_3961 [Polymorphum gilvum SL003B-26A1]
MTSTPDRKRSSPLTRLLLVSLAANLFLAGWVLGGVANRPPRPPFPPDILRDVEMRLEPRLTAAGMERVRATLATVAAEMERSGAAGSSFAEQVAASLRRQPFDEADFRDVVRSAIDRRTAMDLAMLDTVVDLMRDIDPVDRAAFADVIEQLHALRPPPPVRR